MVYLDWAATAMPDPRIWEQGTAAALACYANPSSPHILGKKARQALEEARSRCAQVLGCPGENLIFTSGGTESNNLVILSRLQGALQGEVVISGIEHPSVGQPAELLRRQGWGLKTVLPGTDGRISPQDLAAGISEKTRLAAVMGVNNETGAVQDIESLAAAVREKEALTRRPIPFHADLVQAPGKTSFRLSDMDIDSASFSAHKIRGPRGTGLLYLRKKNLEALYRGGGQEGGLRPGTENLAGAWGMALALETFGRPDPALAPRAEKLISQVLKIPQARIIPQARLSRPENYVPGILLFSFPPIPGEVLVRVMSERGFALSTGSACHQNTRKKGLKPLQGLGLSEQTAASAVRVSFSSAVTEEELDAFVRELTRQTALLAQEIA